MRPAALIYNPKSGRQRHAQVLDAILAALRTSGFDVAPAPTSFAGEATALARQAAAEGGAEVVFAFGGDGTAREVAAGLLGSRAALGLLPGGTVNLLARALALPRDPVAAATLLARSPVRPFDVGLASGSPFLMMASAGLDAQILHTLDTRLKWRYGQSAIVAHGLRQWWSYPYPALVGTADGEPFRATFAAVCNIALYGGAFRLAPDARPDDGRLDLVLFHGTGRAASAAFILDVIRGASHVRRRDVSIRQVAEVSFREPSGAFAQIDGDLCPAQLPLTVRMAPQPLSVLMPGKKS